MKQPKESTSHPTEDKRMAVIAYISSRRVGLVGTTDMRNSCRSHLTVKPSKTIQPTLHQIQLQ